MRRSDNKAFFLFPDALHALVQPARQAAAAEVVRCLPGQAEEEDNARADDCHPVPQAKDVFVPRVERHEDRV
jgi:hypothetical protein